MREHYDFSDAVKNPFAGKKEKGKFNVLVTYDFTNDSKEGEPLTNENLTDTNNEFAAI